MVLLIVNLTRAMDPPRSWGRPNSPPVLPATLLDSFTVVTTSGPLAFSQKACELWRVPFAPLVPMNPFQAALFPVAGLKT